MSYARQFNNAAPSLNIPGVANGTLIRTERNLDYARGPNLPPLNENALTEGAGIVGPENFRTMYGIPIPAPTPTPPYTNARIGPASGAIDWNGNNAIDTATVAVDVNRILSIGTCANASAGQTLNGFDDWSNLRYNFFVAVNFSDGAGRSTDVGIEEQIVKDYLSGILGSTDADGDGVENTVDNCIFAPNANQADSNGNGIGDVCDAATTVLADLSISINDSFDPAQINTPFDYIATVTNAGPNPASNVMVMNQLPSGVTLVSVSPTQGSCSGTSNITCNLGNIANGSSATVTIRVTPTVSGRLDNWVSLSSSTLDPSFFDNSNSVSTTILNSSVTYSISGRVTDSGGNGIAGVIVTLSGSQTGTTQTNSNGDYNFASVVSGGTYTIRPSRFGYVFSPSNRTFPYINGNQSANFTGVQSVTANKRADFDGDSKTDLSVFRPSESNWYVLKSFGSTVQVTSWGLGSDKLVPADYDGDGKTDFAVLRPSDMVWHILQSSNGTVRYQPWGLSNDIPVPGDYDGDGKIDVAVWRPSNGVWYVLRSSDNSLLAYAFGTNGDVPMVGDFDGDGRTDYVVFRPNNTTWYIQQTTSGLKQTLFGLATDKLAPADYDGDGKTDYGVFRPSDGYWYTAPISEANPGQNFTAIPFGTNGDIPATGDYDGDGKYDRAMFRPSNGTWYILKSGDLTSYSTPFGVSSDVPIPSAYIPQ